MEKMRLCQVAYIALLANVSLGLQAGSHPCVLSGPRYQLVADTVNWSMKIGTGQSCIYGLRFNNVMFENVRLLTPPKSGEVELQGPGFIYTASPKFEGEDSFVLVVSGSIRRMRGSSTVRISVYIVRAPATNVIGDGVQGYILDGEGGYVLDGKGGRLTKF
jgi:hypothetical protein